MYRLKLKGVGGEAPFIPDGGSLRPTPIRREMTTNRGGKMDTGNAVLDLGPDPKHLRTEVIPSRTPKKNDNIASDVVPDPDELEPSSRKVRVRQHIDPDVGEEVQIKLRNAHAPKSRRKGSIRIPMHLEDVRTTTAIEAPKMVNTKQAARSHPIDLGDTRDVSIQTPNVPTLRPKTQVSGEANVETYRDQDIQAPHNPLRTRKGGPNIPFALSSGFHCDFNPVMPEHRAKLKKAFDRARPIIQQDPEVGVSVVSVLKFKSKKNAFSGYDQPQTDDHDVGITQRPRSRSDKKVSKATRDVDTFERTEIAQRPRSRSEKKTSKTTRDVDTFERTEIAERPRHRNDKKVSKATRDVDTFERTEIAERPHSKSKKTEPRVQLDAGDDHKMDVKLPHLETREKLTVKNEMDIPEDGIHIDLGHIKRVTKAKKSGGRLAIAVTPFEGEVTISAKPAEMTKKKTAGDSGIGSVDGGEEVQVGGAKMKSKANKKMEQVEFELGPDDKETDAEIEAPKSKNRGVRAELPQFEPTKDDQDVEIEKKKNVLVFT
jgi:hypothetical protein